MALAREALASAAEREAALWAEREDCCAAREADCAEREAAAEDAEAAEAEAAEADADAAEAEDAAAEEADAASRVSGACAVPKTGETQLPLDDESTPGGEIPVCRGSRLDRPSARNW
ncbi:hypothetical protein U1Q18_052097 [Sarracenia purpurea var. burkii]